MSSKGIILWMVQEVFSKLDSHDGDHHEIYLSLELKCPLWQPLVHNAECPPWQQFHDFLFHRHYKLKPGRKIPHPSILRSPADCTSSLISRLVVLACWHFLRLHPRYHCHKRFETVTLKVNASRGSPVVLFLSSNDCHPFLVRQRQSAESKHRPSFWTCGVMLPCFPWLSLNSSSMSWGLNPLLESGEAGDSFFPLSCAGSWSIEIRLGCP